MGDQPCYHPLLDKVIIPPKECFISEEELNATELHELCHATGHPTRLNRDLGGRFGSERYAREELRAEIASSFLMQSLQLRMPEAHIDNHKAYIQSWIEVSLQLRMPEAHIDNHKAYIQSWIEVLNKEPQELFKAIYEAEAIEKYALDKGNINLEKLMEQPEQDKDKEAIEKKNPIKERKQGGDLER